jgi:hypothetical protein
VTLDGESSLPFGARGALARFDPVAAKPCDLLRLPRQREAERSGQRIEEPAQNSVSGAEEPRVETDHHDV